jgi:hypothetical protein
MFHLNLDQARQIQDLADDRFIRAEAEHLATSAAPMATWVGEQGVKRTVALGLTLARQAGFDEAKQIRLYLQLMVAAPGNPGAPSAPSIPATPAAPSQCGPNSVTPCPCAGATVTSEMVMEEPADRARTRMGVGERVRVTYSLGAADWTITGDGELSSPSGATVTYTAPNTAGTVTLTATGAGCSASLSFTIVEPSGVRMIKKFTSAARVEHTVNMPDAGMLTNIFFAPTDVNFHRVQSIELEVMCTPQVSTPVTTPRAIILIPIR